MLIDNIIADVRNQEYRLFLCKMNKEVIRELTAVAFNKVYAPQLGGCDTITFSVPKKFNGQLTQYYSNITGGNVIKVQQGETVRGYFEIQETQIQNDGISEIKNVKCLELEIRLINKQLYLTTGTFKLVDNANPSKGLLNIITNQSKSWSIGTVDSALLTKERYFDISAINCYQLLMEQIQISFECVVQFDSVNNTINCYQLSTYGRKSEIIVSLDNIVESVDIDMNTKEIVNKLHLYGDNELSVYDVNLGQSYIMNLGYFKSTEFISQGLINALNAYDSKVASYVPTYQNYIAQLQSLNAQLVTLNADLLVLQGELMELEKAKSLLISLNEPITSINALITSKNAEIASKNSQISSVNGQINSINTSINGIMLALNMSSNFTTDQLKELDTIIKEDVYQDSTYLVTDSFTYQQKVDVENQLLTAGKNILARTAYPRYRINVNVIDFLKNKEFAHWWDKLYIGDIMRVQIDDTFIAELRVTGYTHDWDNNNLEIQFGDKYQLDDANIQLLDLLKNAVSAGTSVDFNKIIWNDTTTTVKGEVTEFINSALDITKNNIVSGTGIGITINEKGILATRTDPQTNIVSPNQLVITNNGLAISDDAFNTAKLAIGNVNGKMCVVADVIAGKMILGNNMIIQTGSGDFIVDGNGVRITKMSLNMTSANNLSNIQMNPTNGITIQTRPNISSNWTTKFYVDTNGNLQMTGNITASSFIGGNINIGNGNFTVNSSGVLTANSANIVGNITGSNISGSSAVFGTGYKLFLNAENNNGRVMFTDSNNNVLSEIKTVFGDLAIGSYNNDVNIFSNGGNIELNGQVTIYGNRPTFYNRPYVSTESQYVALLSDVSSYSAGTAINIYNNEISLDTSFTNSRYCQNGGGQYIKFQIYSGNLEVFLNDSLYGTIPIN